MQLFVILPPSNDMPQEWRRQSDGTSTSKGSSARLLVCLSLDARCQMPDARCSMIRLFDVELLDASSPS
jgi:hypothetical protein